jgi:inner membrane protein
VDNVTHSLVGAAIAECAAPRGAPARTRAILICAGVVAANAPDVDLLYTGITEAPLGYLLHHRGHSHTLPGLTLLAVIIWSAARFLPRVQPAFAGNERRWLVLIVAGLLSHLSMDAANSYGTHLFYPFSSRWVYGDSVFVLEPWFWALLGAAAALNAGRLGRLLIGCLPTALIAALVYMGLLRPAVALAMGGVVAGMALVMRDWPRRARAAAMLAAAAAIFIVMPVVSHAARSETRRALRAIDGSDIVDIVSDANPGAPWCWTAMTAQIDRVTDTMVVRRATLSLLPRVWPAPSCASARLMSATAMAGEAAASASIVWHRTWRTDVRQLRALYASDCRVRAWLQFGRLPHVANGSIADLRFEHPVGQNFTPMAVAGDATGCPRYVTSWELPRRDLLGQPADAP